MTGFGVATAALGTGSIRIELRALNHRYQDVRLRLPADLAEHGFFLEQLARKHLGRGRFDLSAKVEGAVMTLPVIAFERASHLYQSLSQLRDRLAPGTELPLTALLTLPGVFESSGPDGESMRAAVEAAFTEAQKALDVMRQQEGVALERELRTRLARARVLVRQLTDSSGELVRHHRHKLLERISYLMSDVGVAGGAGINGERLEIEVAMLADKSDITEELVRLESHYSQMELLFGSDEPVGRRLDFLLQEIGREINTVGSKSQHAPLSHLVVELKAETERMREQAANVD